MLANNRVTQPNEIIRLVYFKTVSANLRFRGGRDRIGGCDDRLHRKD